MSRNLIELGLPAGVKIVEGPISRVTVSEDRAEVTRSIELSWEAGRFSVFLDGVTPFLHDASLRIIPESGSGLQPGNARMLRRYVRPGEDERNQEEEYLKRADQLAWKIRSETDQLARTQMLLRNLNVQLSSCRDNFLRKVVNEGSRASEFSNDVDALLGNKAALLKECRDLRRSISDSGRELRILQNETQAEPGLKRKAAGILLSLEAGGPGHGILNISYEVPCAQWRMQHEAHLLETEGADRTMRFISHGMVWQKTGEDWENAELTLSTARPGKNRELKLPGEDRLSLREKTQEEKKEIRVAIRDQKISHSGLPPRDSGPEIADDGGLTRNYQSKGPVNIKSDGKPYLIELEEQEFPCETAYVAASELSERVFLRSRQIAGNRPILAGPVELYRDGGFTGRGFLDYTGGGSAFELYWGSDDFVLLERNVERSDQKAGTFSAQKKETHVSILVRNLRNTPIEFSLKERVPVSELEQVKVEMIEPAQKPAPDEDGILIFPVRVEAKGESRVNYSYRMLLDKNVVL